MKDSISSLLTTPKLSSTVASVRAERHLASRPKLACEGFALLNAPSSVHDFSDPEEIVRVYYPEVAELACAGEIYLGLHNPHHCWSYFSAMHREEALVFKQYDSQAGGIARFTLHSAFRHPNAPPAAPPRESIEARCLVVYQ